MLDDLDRYLEDIERRIDPDEEERLASEWARWMDHTNPSGPLAVAPRPPRPSKLHWPHVNINDALDGGEAGIYRELEGINAQLTAGVPWVMRLRANYGVGNVARAFGCRPFVMPRETDTLPNVVALSEDAVRAIPQRGVPDLDAGGLERIWRFGRDWAARRAGYPNIARYIRVEQPDFQGPLDNLELIMGSSPLFLAMYDEPELVHSLLDTITRTIEALMDRWLNLFPENRAFANYFRHLERGAIALRDDSAMNLSPDMYDEFAAPYDGRLLRRFGGIVHFCGRGDHYISRLAALEGLRGVNMSQPHLNDMDVILAATVDRGLHLTVSAPPFDPGRHDARNLLFLP